MKVFSSIIIAFLLLSFVQIVNAQGDYDFYIQKARQRLADGDCSLAEASYNIYKDMAHKTNKEIERLIEECKGGSLGGANKNAIGSAGGHEYVDLGLPSGTLWATCNIGASKPEDYGDYYAWGETKPQTSNACNWSSYKYANGRFDKLTKYCNDSGYGDNDFTDNLTTLQGSDDPAVSKWGSGWCMPSKVQWDELLANTTNHWTMHNGVGGRCFISKKNGCTLFIPAAGSRWKGELGRSSSYGRYWSCSLYTDDPHGAWFLDFYLDNCDMDIIDRHYGFSVRPVREK